MQLSSELVSQFVKATNDATPEQTLTIVYGYVGYGRINEDSEEDCYYVILDGSTVRTPISQTADVKEGDRVTVMIKDHTATITGNMTSPAPRKESVTEIAGQISELGVVMAHKVSADELQAVSAIIEALRVKLAEIDRLSVTSAEIESLEAIFANLEHVTADDIKVITAQIERLEAIFGEFTDISTEDLDALNAEITNLKGYTADFTYVSAEVLNAVRAQIRSLITDKLDATFANINFAQLDKAQIADLYAESGLIENATIENGFVTGKLVAVEINGDFIRSGTIQAERLLILGQNGLYYQLNVNGGMDPTFEEVPTDSIHGSIIAAKSITADQIHVTDLNAFGAKIGGFTISKNAIHSHLKTGVSVDADGMYMDDEGQLSLGCGDSYLRYYKDGFTYRPNTQDPSDITEEIKDTATFVTDFEQTTKVYSYVDANQVTRYFLRNIEDDTVTPVDRVDRYRLAISADALYFGEDSKLYADQLKGLAERIKIGKTKDEETGDEKPCIELSEGDTDFKQVITNVKTMFMDGSDVKTEINTDGLKTENVTVKREFRQAGFVWAGRDNGNYGLTWTGGSS